MERLFFLVGKKLAEKPAKVTKCSEGKNSKAGLRQGLCQAHVAGTLQERENRLRQPALPLL